MKEQFIILSALCLSFSFLSSCGKKEDPSTQDPPSIEEKASGRPKTSKASKEKSSGQSAAKPAPKIEPAQVEPETPKEETSNEPSSLDPAEGTTPPAVVAFTTELKEKGILKLLKKMENQEEGRGQNPLAMLDMFRDLNELNGKLKTVKMEGLPADLKETVEQFRDATADTTTHLKEMSIPLDILNGGQEALGPWFAKKMSEDPLFLQSMQDWGQTMGELGGEMEEAGTDMNKAFGRYGVDSSVE